MSPSPGDEAYSHQDSNLKSTGGSGAGSGLASVFKGLAGAAKLSKSTPVSLQSSTSINAQIAQHLSASSSAAHSLPQHHAEAFEQLKNGPMSERVAAAHTLRYTVADYPLNPVLDIWYAAKDLIDSKNPAPTRHAGWQLLTECVKHSSSTDLERMEYFRTVSAVANPEDFHLQLAALVDLTNNGRNLSGFDYDVFPLLTKWLKSKFHTTKAARRKQGSRPQGKAIATGEDRDFTQLFHFITSVIKFNFNVADDEAAEALIDALLDICLKTSVEEDLRACIGVMEAIVTFGAIPTEKLKRCVHVLSSIYYMVSSLQKDAWHTFSILCLSHNGQATVRLLLDVLKNAPKNADNRAENVREVRGAITILQKLVSKSSEKGYPAVPYPLLVDGLTTVVKTTSARRVYLDILRLINALFCDAHGNMNSMLDDEDWEPLFDVAAACSKSIYEARDSQSLEEPTNKEKVQELRGLIARIEEILEKQSYTLLQRQDCILFFAKVHRELPDSAAILVLNYAKEFRSCFPTDPDWESNLDLILKAFFANRNRSTDVRIKALQIITEVYDMVELMNDQVEPNFVPGLMKRLLSGVADETDILLLQELVSFSAAIASTADLPLFNYIVETLRDIVGCASLQITVSSSLTPSPEPQVSFESAKHAAKQTPSNVVTRGYVQMFMRVMNHDVTKATRLFHLLVSIVKASRSDTDARLTAMKLLFRLRADWANRVYITPDADVASLASLLHRTEIARARRNAEEAAVSSRLSRGEGGVLARAGRGVSFGQGQPQERGFIMRSASTTKVTPVRQQMWMSDDPEPLPEPTSRAASPVLRSYAPDPDRDLQPDGVSQETTLQAGLWLETVLQLLQQGCDWEIYSFILVHLPSQLSNHAIFRSAIPQLQGLRQTVCEQISKNNFQEPPAAYGLRRADVAICLFHSLTMILSYHQHFNKLEEDEIVRAFVQGIATWERSAKCCIHALSICCHELPTSTGKMLVTILQKMAQIITQPQVAMHILEFLACLYRIPTLYINFREEEYRIVFGICFRYVQYVRDKKQHHRMSYASDTSATPPPTASTIDSQSRPNASDDLPQYVYALGFQVITNWFLALKLQDRANQVGWIAKNLFMDVDGSQFSDDQAQITIDFLQRATYADVDESEADPLFTAARFGEIQKKRWLIGNSIVTIEQATTTGWAQITKRHPSGTSSYIIRENFRPTPPHQRTPGDKIKMEANIVSTNSVLPNHLLVLLLASIPQGPDYGRPIPLPDDDAVNRAVRMFDHTSTVDGHKVGVIYVGEGQTNETDILANVSGSSDYVKFLNGLGTLTRLKGAKFNTQGLDRSYDTDGQYTFCWRDRLTEIVFHVTTQMPTNLDHDPQCTMKKRHIGNDFVNIIFNDSGLPFKFDTFPSDFNYVNIVITPESRASFVASRQRTPNDVDGSFYKVQVMSKPGFPEISPASETKIVSLKALPDFIRLLALNASVFCLVWASRAGGEYISPWRSRLREINRLREKYGAKLTALGPNPSPPGTAMGHGTPAGTTPVSAQLEATKTGNAVRDSFTSLRRSSVATFFTTTSDQNSHRSSTFSTATTDNPDARPAAGAEFLVDSVDFSKWA
ncbi:Tuberous sclerosis 2-like protein [Diatrype stigma]|uniref:Tuberous sclerosis 2-like protein n=1 Tax=Diatrype stigma TaxID=117547 RepID=A0AAN9US17_9PEZI